MSISIKLTLELLDVKGFWQRIDEWGRWKTAADAIADGGSPEQVLRFMAGWSAKETANLSMSIGIDNKEDFFSLQDMSDPHRPFCEISPAVPAFEAPWVIFNNHKRKPNWLAFYFAMGMPEPGSVIIPTCWQPSCCNPNHLREGSGSEFRHHMARNPQYQVRN